MSLSLSLFPLSYFFLLTKDIHGSEPRLISSTSLKTIKTNQHNDAFTFASLPLVLDKALIFGGKLIKLSEIPKT